MMSDLAKLVDVKAWSLYWLVGQTEQWKLFVFANPDRLNSLLQGRIKQWANWAVAPRFLLIFSAINY